MAFGSSLLAALALCAASASAHEIPEPCQGDAAKFCPGMAPGDHHFASCMKEHKNEVTAGCKQAGEKWHKHHEAKKAAAANAAGPAPATAPSPAPAPTPAR
jgi:hypothetical protein